MDKIDSTKNVIGYVKKYLTIEEIKNVSLSSGFKEENKSKDSSNQEDASLKRKSR